MPAPAAAQVGPGYSLSIASDDRFRGHSTSDKRPVATGTISYDHASGVYAGLSLTGGPTRDEGLRVLRSVQYLGYARHVGPGVSLEGGISHRIYSRQATVEYARTFTECYVGVTGRRVASRLFYSPNYDAYHHSATYAEVDALLLNQGDWSVTGHLGLLASPTYRQGDPQRVEVDWRAGVTRRLGRLSLSATLVGGGPDYRDHRFRGTAVFALTRSF